MRGRSRIEQWARDSGLVLISFVVVLPIVQFAATWILPQGSSLTIITDVIQLALAVLAMFAFLVNSARSRGTLRVFWGLFAVSWATLSFNQIVWLFYEVL